MMQMTSVVMLLSAAVVVLGLVTARIFQLYRHQKRKRQEALRTLHESELRYFNGLPGESSSAEHGSGLLRALEQADNLSDKLLKIYEHADTKAHTTASDNLVNKLEEIMKLQHLSQERKSQEDWRVAGLQRLNTILLHQHKTSADLYQAVISFLVKYTEAQVGGLFLLKSAEDQKTLSLQACYAYERKKYLQRELDITHGLVGQCFQEQATIFLKQLPAGYMHITSGLGTHVPVSLILVPIKSHQQIEGVLEIASTRVLTSSQKLFLEESASLLGASVRQIMTTQVTAALLQRSRVQEDELRAQEEELRQNMEELEATHEEMSRQLNELSEVQHALAREKNLFTALMNNLPDAIYFKDRSCKLIRVSKYMAEVFGASEAELIGKSDFDFQDNQHAQEAYDDEQTIMKTRTPKIDFVEKEVRSDGSVHWVSTSKLPLVDADNQVVGTFGLSRDITTYKRLEEENARKTDQLLTTNTTLQATEAELRLKMEELSNTIQELKRAQEQLVESEKSASIREIVAGVAHELNNPLNFVTGGTQAILEILRGLEQDLQAASTDPQAISRVLNERMDDVRAMTGSILKGVDRATGLIANLKTITGNNFESSESDQQIRADACLEATLFKFRERIKSLSIVIYKDYDESIFFVTSPAKLNQAVLQLFDNAIFAVSEQPDRKITLRTRRASDTVLIQIIDNGVGITPAIQSKIMTPFFTTRDVGKGSGLGLSIANTIVRKLGGSISFESGEKTGTSFTITLPLTRHQ